MKTSIIIYLSGTVLFLGIFAHQMCDVAPRVFGEDGDCSIVRLQVVTGPDALLLESSTAFRRQLEFVMHGRYDVSTGSEVYLVYSRVSPISDMGFSAFETDFCIRGDVIGIRYFEAQEVPVFHVEDWIPLSTRVLWFSRSLWHLVILVVGWSFVTTLLIRRRNSDRDYD